MPKVDCTTYYPLHLLVVVVADLPDSVKKRGSAFATKKQFVCGRGKGEGARNLGVINK